MKKGILISLSIYFLVGCMLLPNGDFALLPELPRMYQQCQRTEHSDMNIFGFITDHLINIDSIFDKHENGDEQKPHHPFHFQHVASTSIVQYFPLIFQKIKVFFTTKEMIFQAQENLFSYEYLNYVFRPPISAQNLRFESAKILAPKCART